MYLVAMRLTADTADAQDAVQDAVVKLWQQQSKLYGATSIEGYAITAARNAAIDIARRRHPSATLDGVVERDPGHDPAQVLAIKDRVAHVMEIIDDLPETQRQVILMRDVEEMEFDEIVEATGLSHVNVRAILSRARASIRKHFASV